jgi:hypothetical protein
VQPLDLFHLIITEMNCVSDIHCFPPIAFLASFLSFSEKRKRKERKQKEDKRD